MLILSLFPGIGMLDRAFESEGFCVVRGADKLWGGDIKDFHVPPCKFDAIIGSPPCQCFSNLVHINKSRGFTIAENLIPEFERVVGEAQPEWFLMENVPAAPNPAVVGYSIESFIINNRQIPGENGIGQEQNRLRKFVFGRKGEFIHNFALSMLVETAALENPNFAVTVTTGSGNSRSQDWQPFRLSNGKLASPLNRGGRRAFSEMVRLQGLPENFLDDAPFTTEGKRRVVGNGVPLPMGKALAKAVKKYFSFEAD
jgi:DNA (cytosine-5)-methyltransferase 1